jgi:uncharacterized membrane protein YvlD (DUF360 family)
MIKLTYAVQIAACVLALAAWVCGGFAFVQQQYWLVVMNAIVMMANAAIFGAQIYLRRRLRSLNCD